MRKSTMYAAAGTLAAAAAGVGAAAYAKRHDGQGRAGRGQRGGRSLGALLRGRAHGQAETGNGFGEGASTAPKQRISARKATQRTTRGAKLAGTGTAGSTMRGQGRAKVKAAGRGRATG